jgi:hypothetical protein
MVCVLFISIFFILANCVVFTALFFVKRYDLAFDGALWKTKYLLRWPSIESSELEPLMYRTASDSPLAVNKTNKNKKQTTIHNNNFFYS